LKFNNFNIFTNGFEMIVKNKNLSDFKFIIGKKHFLFIKLFYRFARLYSPSEINFKKYLKRSNVIVFRPCLSNNRIFYFRTVIHRNKLKLKSLKIITVSFIKIKLTFFMIFRMAFINIVNFSSKNSQTYTSIRKSDQKSIASKI